MFFLLGVTLSIVCSPLSTYKMTYFIMIDVALSDQFGRLIANFKKSLGVANQEAIQSVGGFAKDDRMQLKGFVVP